MHRLVATKRMANKRSHPRRGVRLPRNSGLRDAALAPFWPRLVEIFLLELGEKKRAAHPGAAHKPKHLRRNARG